MMAKWRIHLVGERLTRDVEYCASWKGLQALDVCGNLDSCLEDCRWLANAWGLNSVLVGSADAMEYLALDKILKCTNLVQIVNIQNRYKY